MTTTTQTRIVATLDPQGRGVILEEPVPAVGPGHVLVRIRATMVSPGTQLSGIREIRQGSAPPMAKPRRLGYQAAGEIVGVGEHVASLKAGQRVACFGGGALHTNLAVVPQNLCAPLPDSVSFEDASGMNLVLTALHAVRRAQATLGEFLLVVGLGTVGQLAAQFGRASGLYVMGWDTTAGRMEIARRVSADAVINPRQDGWQADCASFTEGLGFDAAIMAIGGDGTPALEQVKQVMKVSADGHAMGNIVMVGGLKTLSGWGAGMGNLNLLSSARTGPGYHDPAWEAGELSYPNVFVRWSTQTNLRLALRMIADGRLDVGSLITHRLPLKQIEQAVDLLIGKPDEALAVVLTPDQQ